MCRLPKSATPIFIATLNPIKICSSPKILCDCKARIPILPTGMGFRADPNTRVFQNHPRACKYRTTMWRWQEHFRALRTLWSMRWTVWVLTPSLALGRWRHPAKRAPQASLRPHQPPHIQGYERCDGNSTTWHYTLQRVRCVVSLAALYYALHSNLHSE